MSSLSHEFCASYNVKDVILYALSIGFGNNRERYERDLRYLYENHPNFTIVPTFYLALQFLAVENYGNGNRTGIPSFPPPLLSSVGMIPASSLRNGSCINVSDYPAIHSHSSISWNATNNDQSNRKIIPSPRGDSHIVTTPLKHRFLSVVPKSVGTFVTCEISAFTTTTAPKRDKPSNKLSLLCTMQSTTLLLGLPPESVIPMSKHTSKKSVSAATSIPLRTPVNEKPLFETVCTVSTNQALIYRLASGDSNRIHVDPSASPSLLATEGKNSGKDGVPPSRPLLLHGLCTLGIATRVLLQFVNDKYQPQHEECYLRHIEGKFVKPVFLHDKICVKLWDVPTDGNNMLYFAFSVHKRDASNQEIVLLDKGYAMMELVRCKTNNMKVVSRL